MCKQAIIYIITHKNQHISTYLKITHKTLTRTRISMPHRIIATKTNTHATKMVCTSPILFKLHTYTHTKHSHTHAINRTRLYELYVCYICMHLCCIASSRSMRNLVDLRRLSPCNFLWYEYTHTHTTHANTQKHTLRLNILISSHIFVCVL